jgi:hypothetical protein
VVGNVHTFVARASSYINVSSVFGVQLAEGINLDQKLKGPSVVEGEMAGIVGAQAGTGGLGMVEQTFWHC